MGNSADLMRCRHGAGFPRDPQARLWWDFFPSEGCELEFPAGSMHRECSWAHSSPQWWPGTESPAPSSRCLKAGPQGQHLLWSRGREASTFRY